MRPRIIVSLITGIGFTAFLLLPLRVIKQRTFVSDEIRLRSGIITACVDGTYYPMPVKFWYTGWQTGAPFRLRVFYRASDLAEHQVALARATITDSGVAQPLAVGVGRWERDRDGKSIYIAGFLNVPLTASHAVAEMELSLDGAHTSAKLHLARSCNTEIVHSWWEAMMGT